MALSGNDFDSSASGGAGVEEVSFDVSPEPVNLEVASGKAVIGNGNDEVTDTLRTFERYVGSKHDDSLVRDKNHNELDGGPGDDTCFNSTPQFTSACETTTTG